MSLPVPMMLLQVQYIAQGENVYKVLVPKELSQGQNEEETVIPKTEQPVNPIICQVQDLNEFQEQCSVGTKETPHLTSFVNLSSKFQTVKSLVRLDVKSPISENKIATPVLLNTSETVSSSNVQTKVSEHDLSRGCLSKLPLKTCVYKHVAISRNNFIAASKSATVQSTNLRTLQDQQHTNHVLNIISPISKLEMGTGTEGINSISHTSEGKTLESASLRENSGINKLLNLSVKSITEESTPKKSAHIIKVGRTLTVPFTKSLNNSKFENKKAVVNARLCNLDQGVEKHEISVPDTKSGLLPSAHNSNKDFDAAPEFSPSKDATSVKTVSSPQPVVISALSSKLNLKQEDANSTASSVKRTPVDFPLKKIVEINSSRLLNKQIALAVANKTVLKTFGSLLLHRDESPSVVSTAVTRSVSITTPRGSVVPLATKNVTLCKTCGSQSCFIHNTNIINKTEVSKKGPTIVMLNFKAVPECESINSQVNISKESDSVLMSTFAGKPDTCKQEKKFELIVSKPEVMYNKPMPFIQNDSELDSKTDSKLHFRNTFSNSDIQKNLNCSQANEPKKSDTTKINYESDKDNNSLYISDKHDDNRMSINIPTELQFRKVPCVTTQNNCRYIKHQDVTVPEIDRRFKKVTEDFQASVTGATNAFPTMERSISILRKVVKMPMKSFNSNVNNSKETPKAVINTILSSSSSLSSGAQQMQEVNSSKENPKTVTDKIICSSTALGNEEKQIQGVEQSCSTNSAMHGKSKMCSSHAQNVRAPPKKKKCSEVCTTRTGGNLRRKKVSAKIIVQPVIKIKIGKQNCTIRPNDSSLLTNSDSSSSDSETTDKSETLFMYRRRTHNSYNKVSGKTNEHNLSESSDSDIETDKCKAIELEMEYQRKSALNVKKRGFFDRSLITDRSYLSNELKSIKQAIKYLKNKIRKQSKRKKRLRKLMKLIKPCQVKMHKLNFLEGYDTTMKKVPRLDIGKSSQGNLNDSTSLQNKLPDNLSNNKLTTLAHPICNLSHELPYYDVTTATSDLNTGDVRSNLINKKPVITTQQASNEKNADQVNLDFPTTPLKPVVKKRRRKKRQSMYSFKNKKIRKADCQSSNNAHGYKADVARTTDEKNVKIEPCHDEGSIHNCTFGMDADNNTSVIHKFSEQSKSTHENENSVLIKTECNRASDGEEVSKSGYESAHKCSHQFPARIKIEPTEEEEEEEEDEFMFEVDSESVIQSEGSFNCGQITEEYTKVKSENLNTKCDTDNSDLVNISSEKYASLMKLIEEKSQLLKTFREKRLSRTKES